MRAIPENNLAYPVLIVLESGHSGSGFQLKVENEMYLVTAKHVLFDDSGKLKSNKAKLVCQTADINDDTTTSFSIDFQILEKAKLIFSHKTKDVAAFKLGSTVDNSDGIGYKTHSIPGVNLIQEGKSSIVSVSSSFVLLMKDVLVSNDIFLYGYPSSLGLKKSPQFDYGKPLLRKGIVASINKTQGTLILDCPVYYGNSGGPVVQVSQKGNKNTHNIVGVVSQFIPYAENWINQSNKIVHTEISNSGYSVAVSMDYVYEMLKKE